MIKVSTCLVSPYLAFDHVVLDLHPLRAYKWDTPRCTKGEEGRIYILEDYITWLMLVGTLKKTETGHQ